MYTLVLYLPLSEQLMDFGDLLFLHLVQPILVISGCTTTMHTLMTF